ncbi:MAG: N-acetylmuramoyl-L-alanine amidase [Desulfobacteraceae bacterium]|nr:N-acetylmuramoyl-L-alanine amidase [Desulfobacteraceae bacterium]
MGVLSALLLLAILGAGCGSGGHVAPPVEPSPQAWATRQPSQPGKSRQPPPPVRSGPAHVAEQSVAATGGPRNIVHEVGPLETVWRISRMYGVTPESIYAANRLKPNDVLQNGQKLVIPNARMIRHVVNLYPNTCWKYIILHHTATDSGSARTINNAHGDRGFWNGLGYHFLIDNGTLGKGDGQIEMSPRWIRQQTGAHCKAGGMNEKSIGIALVGNFNNEAPTPNQMQALEYLLKALRDYYRIPVTNVAGHREVDGAKTECPGRLFPLSSIRQTYSRR